MSSFENHSRVHTGEIPIQCIGEELYKCQYCEDFFPENLSLENHLRYCEKGLALKIDHTRHHYIHNGEKVNQCNNFENPFLKSNFANQLRANTGEKLFQCIYCEKSFSSKGNYNRHLKSHTGEKPYKCQECEKAYTSKDNLEIHSRVHTGEKAYQCIHCEKHFSNKRNYMNHQLMHTGEKLFQCPICEKGFHIKLSFENHLKIHSGEKPFQCSIWLGACIRQVMKKLWNFS